MNKETISKADAIAYFNENSLYIYNQVIEEDTASKFLPHIKPKDIGFILFYNMKNHTDYFTMGNAEQYPLMTFFTLDGFLKLVSWNNYKSFFINDKKSKDKQ